MNAVLPSLIQEGFFKYSMPQPYILPIAEISEFKGQEIVSCFFSPDGLYLIVVLKKNQIFLIDYNEEKIKITLIGQQKSLINCVISPDSQFIASFLDGGLVEIWDLLNQKCINIIDTNIPSIFGIKIDPENHDLLIIGTDFKFYCWEFLSGRLKTKLNFQHSEFHSIVFSPNCNLIALLCDKKIEIWNIRTWEKQTEFIGHQGRVLSVSFSLDEYTLVSNDSFNSILWSLKSFKKVTDYSEPVSGLIDLQFAPNGNWFLVRSSQRNLILWENSLHSLQRCNNLYETAMHTSELQITHFAFHPKDSLIIYSDSSGKIFFMNIKGIKYD